MLHVRQSYKLVCSVMQDDQDIVDLLASLQPNSVTADGLYAAALQGLPGAATAASQASVLCCVLVHCGRSFVTGEHMLLASTCLQVLSHITRYSDGCMPITGCYSYHACMLHWGEGRVPHPGVLQMDGIPNGLASMLQEPPVVDKVAAVASAIQQALQGADSGRYLKPMLTSYAVQGNPEGALALIKQVKEAQLQQGQQTSAAAVPHMNGTADTETLSAHTASAPPVHMNGVNKDRTRATQSGSTSLAEAIDRNGTATGQEQTVVEQLQGQVNGHRAAVTAEAGLKHVMLTVHEEKLYRQAS